MVEIKTTKKITTTEEDVEAVQDIAVEYIAGKCKKAEAIKKIAEALKVKKGEVQDILDHLTAPTPTKPTENKK